MSYDISLNHPTTGQTLPTDHFIDGGTHKINGDNACTLNVTYNYAEVYSIAQFNLRELAGHKAEMTLPSLRQVRTALGGDKERPPRPYGDYWAPTPGNALVAINRLITFAEQNPEGIWEVT